MHDLHDKIMERISGLRKIVRTKEDSLKKAPKGLVNIHKAGDRVQYYYKKSPDDKVRRYLKESEKKLVKKLCQKDYDQKVLASARKELKLLEKFQKIYEGQICEEIYENLHEHRQIFVDPIWLSDEKFVEHWEAVTYQPMKFKETTPEYYHSRP